MRDEFRFIERLQSLIPRSLQGPFPIGDDAAILPQAKGRCLLLTTDACVEGVDFVIGPSGASPEQIGHKALAVNLSDLAAMGGRPLAFVVAFGIPRKFSEAWVGRVARGIFRLARRFHTPWVGGDLSRAKEFFISIALLGEGQTKRIVRRKGARPGDRIYVTGTLGGSLLGKHLRFIPRIEEARFLTKAFSPHAMIDLSDGLIQDLEHVLRASGAGAKIHLDQIPISQAAWRKAQGLRRKALESALTDGEDFELLFTLPAKECGRLEEAWRRRFPRLSLTRLGEIEAGPRKIEWWDQGKRVQHLWFRKKGFRHF